MFIRLEVIVPFHFAEVLDNDGQEHVYKDENHSYTVEEKHERPKNSICPLQADVTKFPQHYADEGLNSRHESVEFVQLVGKYQIAKMGEADEYEPEDNSEVHELPTSRFDRTSE